MSGNETGNGELSPNSRAFEYVAGTMRGSERRAFEAELTNDRDLQQAVGFWEEQLMAMAPQQERPPKPETWDNITRAVQTQSRAETPATPTRWSFMEFWRWGLPTFAAFLLMAVLIGYYPQVQRDEIPVADYVAVLTDDSGKALLTALTARQGGTTMTLKWEIEAFSTETHAQLWAVSRRDGQIRPLAVFDTPSRASLALDEAAWRLVTDAEYLLLTEEEKGGSAIDEPSEVLLAKGYCVRLTSQQKPI